MPVLTKEKLERLLLVLGDGDREKGVQKYLWLQTRLSRYFAFRGSACVDEMVDDTLDRLADRADSTTAPKATSFAYGIARYVAGEGCGGPPEGPLPPNIPAPVSDRPSPISHTGVRREEAPLSAIIHS